PPAIDAAALRAHLTFLADDAQEGRSPGTEADRRVQDHIEAAMRSLGLEPAFGGAYRQPFEVTDGIRPRDGAPSVLTLGKAALPHAMLPFGHDTADAPPIEAELIFVGHGIAPEGPKTGDYTALGDKVRGKIAVVLTGAPNDPHLSPAATRPQSKVIAARDHGAVGVILVDPESDLPFPNHGQVTDLQIPVVAVTKAQAPALFAALGARKGSPKPGARSRVKARLATPFTPVVLTTANVGGVLRGGGDDGRRIVLGAHMDHLGFGTSASLAPGAHEIHNGADDNASGVSTMLALAAALAQVPPASRPYDLVFFAFGAEEMGLLGSKHLVEAIPEAERPHMVAMLNFDMVGRLRENAVVVAGTGTAKQWPSLLERSAGPLTVRPSDDGYGASDQTSFYEVGVPVLHFFTGPHDDYHRPSDDLAAINVDGATAVGGLALRVVGLLMTERPALEYVKVARPTGTRGGFRVSLGTVPDYAAQVDGVKLSGVRPGGPAEAAGLRAGDVIVRIGDRDIHNLDDYMASFAALQPGVEVIVTVLRESDRVDLRLTPAASRGR
ncbi:MAG TPA: M20/M25/M40 family metallo-hydrolase, partial [Nannocystaceae bacterium]|nr:M20/M25/M40 family metallo-hydrolase [Nannocystaceae bacterium]